MGVRGFESDVMDNFKDGVITSVTADNVPNSALRLARNTKFHNVGPGVSIFGTRDGFDVKTNDALFAGEILALHQVKRIDQQFVLGQINDSLASASSLYRWDGGTIATIIGSGDDFSQERLDFADIGQFTYMVNGDQMKKTDGLTMSRIGIARPVAIAWTAANVAGGSSLPVGDYDVIITYYNADSGHEGPRSVDIKTVTVAGGEKLRVVLPSRDTVDDVQVTDAYIYIRQQATTNEFFRVVAGATPAPGDTLSFSLAQSVTTTVDIDPTQDQIDAFITKAPGENDNLIEPISPFRFVASYRQRLMACDDEFLYWSESGSPEAMNTEDNKLPIATGDGERITGMIVHDDTLVIFKPNRTYYLDGDDPETWVLRVLDQTVGCISRKGYGIQEGNLYFYTLNGPHRWKGRQSGVEDINTDVVGNLFDGQQVDFTRPDEFFVALDDKNHYVGFSCPTFGESSSSVIIPFSTRLDRWMSSGWDGVNATCACLQTGIDGTQEALYGDEFGNLYTMLPGKPDGIPSTVTYTSSSLLTAPIPAWDSGTAYEAGEVVSYFGTDYIATVLNLNNDPVSFLGTYWEIFDGSRIKIDATVPGSLVGRYVWVWKTSNSGTILTAEKRIITANQANVLVLNPALSAEPNIPTETWSYALGGIMQDMRTGFRSGGAPFNRKRIEFCFLQFTTTQPIDNGLLMVYKDEAFDPSMTHALTATGVDVFDTALFDTARFDNLGLNTRRHAVKTVGRSWQTRIIYLATNGQFLWRKVGVEWLSKTRKAER